MVVYSFYLFDRHGRFHDVLTKFDIMLNTS